MIRLTHLYIKGFKDPDREINLKFSEEPISVIFGENGSGKTTLLKVLQAVFRKDYEYLLRENIQEIKIQFTVGNESFELVLIKKRIIEDGSDLNIPRYKFRDESPNSSSYSYLQKGKSILFGVHRGITSALFSFQKYSNEDILSFIIKENEKFLIKQNASFNYNGNKDKLILDKFLDQITQTLTHREVNDNLNNSLTDSNHISKDFITIEEIETAILKQYAEGRAAVQKKTTSAFFETIEEFENMSDEDFEIDENIKNRIKDKHDFIFSAISSQADSSLKKRLLDYLDSWDGKELESSKISRALILNILEKAEEPNPSLDAVTKLLEVFNDNLNYGKKLIIGEEEVYISLGKGKRHELELLSSGERNLLTMLTLFLIIGRGRDFLIIDEPEISMNLKWQRKFLPLISELNPNSQIIVASHSPAIAAKDSRYLVELK